MSGRNLPYDAGSVFAVPLPSGAFAIGVVALTNDKGLILGYFFGPPQPDVESVGGQIAVLCADKADYVARAGDLGLIEGKWPVVGEIPKWNQVEWPLPEFRFVDPLFHKSYRTIYERVDDTGRRVPAAVEEIASLPEDGVAGAGFVEKRLGRLLETNVD